MEANTALPVSNVKTNYKSKASKVLSILQIVGGILIMVFGLGTALPLFMIMAGRWTNLVGAAFEMILLLICGGIGIGASKKKTSCLIISHMVLCILASICIIGPVLQGVESVLHVANLTYEDQDSVDSQENRDYIENPEISYVMGGFLFLLCLMEFIVCVWGLVLGCKVTCCSGSNGNQKHTNPSVQYGQIDPANPHVVVINGEGYPVGTGPVETKDQETLGN